MFYCFKPSYRKLATNDVKDFVKSKTSKRLLIACALTLLFNACQPTNSSTAVKEFDADHYFPIQFAENSIYLQLALTDSEQTRGLMHRSSLKRDHGMLFIFQEPGQQAFWMRNTSIPLDLAYLNPSGTVVEIHKLYPYDERSVPSHSKNISLVLEMNQGWFDANQITPGSQINCRQIEIAVLSRGFNPEKFAVNWKSQTKKIDQ